MLVLSRHPQEKILFPDLQVSVQVVSIKGGAVRLGIDAPPEVTILREEVPDRTAEWGPADAPVGGANLRQLNDLLQKRLQIGSLGLAELRRQLGEGVGADVARTLDQLAEELHMLRQRVACELREPTPRRAKALLVEDNRDERELLATFLRTAGIDVDTSNDGCDALDYLHHRERPDVVLLDMGLPRMDGQTMVRQLRRDRIYAGLKIFAVTGSGPDEFKLDAGPAGIDRWFRKPINPEVLLHDLQQELDSTLSCP